MPRTELKRVKAWVTKLAALTSAGSTPVDPDRINVMAEMLADDFPPGAFLDLSVRVVAEGCEFFPSYAVLKTALRTWHDEYQARLEGPKLQTIEPWMVKIILRNCGNQPGPKLTNWLASKGVTPPWPEIGYE